MISNVSACKMKNPGNPYDAGRNPTNNDGRLHQRKRLSLIEIIVSLAILSSIFTLFSPALYSGKQVEPTPDFMRHYVVPLSAPIFQRTACVILVLTFGFMGIGVLVAWIRTRRALGTKREEYPEVLPEPTSNTVYVNTVLGKCTKHPVD